MLEVVETGFLVIAAVGLLMVSGAAMSRDTKRLLRLSDETVDSAWFRKADTSGLSLAIHWLKPGLILMSGGTAAALLLDVIP